MLDKPQNNPRLIGGIYRIGQTITSGPMLSTYTAYNRNTTDVVGLQVFELPPMFDYQAVSGLLQTLQQRRQVQSPHVLRVHDWGIDISRAYIATDPPRGITLRHLLDNENIDVQRALDLARQMTLGVCALQSQGIVGTDLRPQLITIDSVGMSDRAQLDDIGLRPLLKQLGYINSQRTDDIGYLDPRYAPPEWIAGGQTGPWTDVYSLGLLLFELITNRPPFVGRNPEETAMLQSTASIPRLAQFKHGTPEALQTVIDMALAKNPAARFATATALLTALDEIRPARRPLSAEGSQGVAATIPPGQGPLTNEMPRVADDLTLRATLIEGRPDQSSPAPIPAIPTEKGIFAYLCSEIDGTETKQFEMNNQSVVVGRTDPKRNLKPDIDLTTLDPKMTVSRQHARIRYEGTFFYIEDLKSRNKTRLGDVTLTPLKPEMLHHGDQVRFGAVRMVFKVPGVKEVQKKSG
jgi:serine/threonine protein kinase